MERKMPTGLKGKLLVARGKKNRIQNLISKERQRSVRKESTPTEPWKMDPIDCSTTKTEFGRRRPALSA